MEICALMSVKEAQAWVASELNHPELARTTFYNWRRFLGMTDNCLSVDQAKSIALFGGYVRKGMSMKSAFSACKRQLNLR